MTEPQAFPSPRAFPCPRCGALNGADFDRCIRCGLELSKGAATAVPSDPDQSARADRQRLRAAIEGGYPYWATKITVGLTAIIFAGQVLASLHRGTGLPLLSGGHPADLLRFGVMQMSLETVREEPFRLLSCVFVHFGALHFGLNMMGLVNFARIAEPAVGPARFLIAYVVSGLVGSIVTIAFTVLTGSPGGLTAGASGAIFGVMGLLLGWLIRKKNPAWKDFAVQAVLFSVLFGFGVNASKMGVMINNTAHVGGLLCGIVFGLLYGGGGDRKPQSGLGANIAAGLCLLACVASLVLSQLSPTWRRLEKTLSVRTSTSRVGDVALRAAERVIAPPDSNV